MKKVVLKNFTKIYRETPAPESFLNNFFKKETLVQVFSCESCETFKNTFFTEHLRTAAFL